MKGQEKYGKYYFIEYIIGHIYWSLLLYQRSVKNQMFNFKWCGLPLYKTTKFNKSETVQECSW